jgi:hypothetical protein
LSLSYLNLMFPKNRLNLNFHSNLMFPNCQMNR